VTNEIVIVGLGARTSLGRRSSTSAAAAFAGISRVREHPTMRDKNGDPFMIALDSSIPETRRHQRMLTLATSAIMEGVCALPLSTSTSIYMFLGLPEPGCGFTLQQAKTLCESLTRTLAKYRPAQVVPIMQGDAAGVAALEQAMVGIRSSAFEICVVGGVDSLLDPDLLEALDDEGRVASVTNRWGFPPGEGAGVLVLCTASFARHHGLPVLASLHGLGSAFETSRPHEGEPCTGEGLALAIRRAAAQSLEPIGRQFCDINGDRDREHEFSYAILRLPSRLFIDSLDYDGPANRWGHVGAASATLLAQLPIFAHLRRDQANGESMIWCGSNDGYRGAFVLRHERTERP